jgi:hypothetical protein
MDPNIQEQQIPTQNRKQSSERTTNKRPRGYVSPVYQQQTDIREAFSYRNIRFEHLFNCSYFSLKLKIPFMSKSNFNKRYTNIITSYIH